MGIAQSTSVRLPVKLLTTLGADPTGILPADVLNGIAQIVKADGTTSEFKSLTTTRSSFLKKGKLRRVVCVILIAQVESLNPFVQNIGIYFNFTFCLKSGNQRI